MVSTRDNSAEGSGDLVRTQSEQGFPREDMRIEVRSALEILDRALAQLAEEPPPVSAENKGFESACEAGFSRAIKKMAARDIRFAQSRLEWLSKNLAEEAEEAS